MSASAEFHIVLLKETISIRTEKMKAVMKEYNDLQRKMDALKDKEADMQRKLNVLQEKAESMACENFNDKSRLDTIIRKNQKHEFSNLTN